MSTLRDRVRVALQAQFGADVRDDDVDWIESFVLAEQARRYAPQFVDAVPLVLWFATHADRDGFTELWLREHPDGKAIKVDP